MVNRLARWVEDRLGLGKLADFLLHHPIPEENTGRKGWLYVLGAAALTALIIQVITGIALATKYVPSPAHAYASLKFITDEAPLGALLRALHYWGASAMVLLVFIHMARVFLTGSFKFPRELNWISGAVLLGLVLAMAGTGQLLRWDENGIWTVVVWAQFAERVPWLGEHIARFILAGDTVGGPTLSRFFALHVLVFPALILLFLGLHLYLVLHHGISEPPKAGAPVDPGTYRRSYEALLERGRPYWPYGVWREAVAAAAVVVVVLLLALTFGPKGPGVAPDPTRVEVVPKPDWFFLWYYTLVWLKPPGLETLTMVVLPLAVGVVLFLLPLLASRGERHPARRPWAVLAVLVTALLFAVLTGLGLDPRWVPDFGTERLTAAELGPVEAPVLAGADLFFDRGCQYCHAVLGRGGRYGPELTAVARRMPPEEITVRIVAGVRHMPAYRDILTTAEVETIVAFLRHLGARP